MSNMRTTLQTVPESLPADHVTVSSNPKVHSHYLNLKSFSFKWTKREDTPRYCVAETVFSEIVFRYWKTEKLSDWPKESKIDENHSIDIVTEIFSGCWDLCNCADAAFDVLHKSSIPTTKMALMAVLSCKVKKNI